MRRGAGFEVLGFADGAGLDFFGLRFEGLPSFVTMRRGAGFDFFGFEVLGFADGAGFDFLGFEVLGFADGAGFDFLGFVIGAVCCLVFCLLGFPFVVTTRFDNAEFGSSSGKKRAFTLHVSDMLATMSRASLFCMMSWSTASFRCINIVMFDRAL